MARWLQSPPGRYLLGWEQHHLDLTVADLFGFHALQLGLPELDALRANRMPHRWIAQDSLLVPEPMTLPPPPQDEGITVLPARAGPASAVSMLCDFDALPFPSGSVDLLVLPHTLELARDPHLTLREVERVLVPEGRAVIVGFNPASLWGVRQRTGHARGMLGLRGADDLFMPRSGEFVAYRRLRDWLRLLSFEVESGHFGCWRPPVATQRWLDRFAWMERAGQRWWPVLGALYMLVAVKRVRGIRLVGLARREKLAPKAAPAVVANRRR